MPRYFFHFHNDIDTFDEEGLELANDAAARTQAIAEARAIAADSVRHGSLDLNHRIEVVTADGGGVQVVRFGDALRLKPLAVALAAVPR